MNVLVTGSSGFIGKNLIISLKEKINDIIILEFDIENTIEELYSSINSADYIFHLAGINRPLTNDEYYKGNVDLTKLLCDIVEKTNRNIPITVSSSTQATIENDYGNSKKLAEDYLFKYSKRTSNEVNVYRLPNVFGKWCKPNYNSAVATFCHNIANDLPVIINDRDYIITLVYIDDVIAEFMNVLDGKQNKVSNFCDIPVADKAKLGGIVDLIYSFRDSRLTKMVPNMSNGFQKKLYSTYLSYLPKKEFSYELKMNNDNRGSFTEFLKSNDRGQVSVNISKPGIVKGNHWHHTKNEKFMVVFGRGVIRFRNVLDDEIIEYLVSGEKLQVVDIPVGYTHNIENTGNTDMVTIMWANEIFNPEKPDTFYLEV